MRQDSETQARRIVLSIGTRVIQTPAGSLDYNVLIGVSRLVVDVLKLGYQIIVVSAGAVAAGREICTTLRSVSNDQKKKVYYAVGQPRLVSVYKEFFAHSHLTVGEILVGRSAFSNRLHYISIRETVSALLSNNMVPLINDNDILQDDGDEVADNDYLSAYLAGMMSADSVVFLVDQKGIFDGEPNGESVMPKWQGEILELASENVLRHPGNQNILGKIKALNLLHELGIDGTVCHGRDPGAVRSALLGDDVGTRMHAPKKKKLSGTRKWLATGAMPKGSIIVSLNGAESMINVEQRGSLLARGIEEISGRFQKGDVVSVCDVHGRLLGYGITRYGSEELPILLNQDSVIVVHANYFYGANLEWYLRGTQSLSG